MKTTIIWLFLCLGISSYASPLNTIGQEVAQSADRTELLRLAKQCLDSDYYKYTEARKLLQHQISKLPNDERLKMIRDSNDQIRVATINSLSEYFRAHVDEWGQFVKERERKVDRCALMDAFEPDKLSHSDLVSFLNVCYRFRTSDHRVLRSSVIECMGRAKVRSKEDLGLVQSVLGLFATDGGHEKDRYRAFQVSHELYKANKF